MEILNVLLVLLPNLELIWEENVYVFLATTLMESINYVSNAIIVAKIALP